MSMGRKLFAARWRQFREPGPIEAGRDSAPRFVSGVLCCRMQHTGQGQVATGHARLCTPEQVAHLRAQLAVFVPAKDDGFQPEQGLGNVAVRRARL